MIKLRIRTENLKLTLSERADALRRLSIELERFGDRIAGVTLKISRGKASKKGFERHCLLELTLPSKKVSTQQADPILSVALDAVAQRAARDIARLLEREHWALGLPVVLR